MTGLTNEQVAGYRAQGVLFPLPAIDPSQIRICLDALARIDQLPEPARKRVISNKSHLVSKALWDLVHTPAILDQVQSVIGPDLLVWGASFFRKAGGAKDFVSWHQDATYWGLEPPDITTAWVALSPSTVEAGCMRVVPGSQHEKLPHVETYGADNMLSRGQEIAFDVKDREVVDVVLKPGQMSLHHVLIAHGSEPNRANHPRIGFAIRYIGGHVRQTGGMRDSATLVRGENRAGTFDLEQAPSGELEPADLARHAALYEVAPHLPKKAM